MLFPTKMCKARIIGLRKDESAFVSVLHELGIVEIKELNESAVQKEYSQEHFAQVTEELLKIESALKLLPPIEIKKSRKLIDYRQALKTVKKTGFHEKLSKIRQRKEELLVQKQSFTETLQKLKIFKKFNIDFSFLSKSEVVETVAAKMSAKNFLHLENSLTEQQIIFSAVEKEISKTEIIAIIVFDKKETEKVKGALDNARAVIELLPSISGKVEAAIKKISEEMLVVEKKILQIEKELQDYSNKYYADFVFLKDVLANESERAQATSKFGRTQDFFVMEGFLAEKNFEKLKARLEQKFPQRVFFEKFSFHELHHEIEEVPTILENPKQLSAFEFMTRFISLPQSMDIDPTIIFAFVFPIIYGMMLGDFGYGLISIAIALLIRKFSAPEGLLRPISTIWAIAAIPTMSFGIIFDEYFGFSHAELAEKFGLHIKPLYHGLERMHNIQELLMITIAVGFLVILFGFLLGFVKEWREHKKAYAVAKLAWITLLVFGAGMLLAFAVNAGTAALAVTGIGFLVSLAVIVKIEGIIGIIELPSVASNILSFARILAVGLASVVVAVTLNDLAFPSLDKGILVLVILPIYLFGHVFNTFLGMFESLIQGARLNYVEFYSKFYAGGGKEFSPFKIKITNSSNTKRR